MWNYLVYYQSVKSTAAEMLKIQMLEQIVTSDSVAEQQKQEEHEQKQQQQQQQDEQNGYGILFWKKNSKKRSFDEKCLKVYSCYCITYKLGSIIKVLWKRLISLISYKIYVMLKVYKS